jgi:PBSX family phage terminase large subunit
MQLLPYQDRLAFGTAKIRALIGGTGTGKTFMLPFLLHNAIQEKPDGRFIVSSPTYNMMIQNPINYIERWMQKCGAKYRLNKSTMEMSFEGLDAIVYFRSAENSQGLQGVHADAIFGDEAGLYKREWFDVAIQRLGFTGGTLWLLTTPYSQNWLKSDVYDKWLKGDTTIQVENPKSSDNPHYPQSNIDHAKATLPKWKFDMLFEGIFTKPSGLIYTDYKTCKPFAIPPNAQRFGGLDFGWNNPSAYIEIVELDGIFYVVDEKKSGEMTEEEIYTLWLKDKRFPIYADPASKTTLEGIRRRGANLREAKKDVMAGLLFITGLVKTGKVVFFDTLINTIDELNTYQWAMDRTENLIDKPVKSNDHLMDSLRYGLFSYTKPMKNPSMSYPI